MSNDPHGSRLTRPDGAPLPDRFENPGLPPHHGRLGDADPRANKRSERIVVVLFTISVLGTLGALVAYVALPPGTTPATMQRSNLAIGLGLTCALLGIGVGAIHWAKTLMKHDDIVDTRHPIRSDDATREVAVEVLAEGAADASLGRRTVLKGAVVTSLALFPLTIAVPLIGNVGADWDVASFKHTMWKKGTRLTTDPLGRPIKAADVTIGSITSVIPEGLDKTAHPLDEKAKAVVILLRLDPSELTVPAGRESWQYDGIIAYSKICTHVGCPVALYERQTHHLLCPCHQSTFDVSDGAKVVFGPARRPLPQLPIAVDADGYLVAQSDFHEPVGPSFWERLS